MNPLDHAEAIRALGVLAVLPTLPGKKSPAVGEWKRFQDQPQTSRELREAFEDAQDGCGFWALMGGDFFAIDTDSPEADAALRDAIPKLGRTWHYATKRGHHYWFRHPGGRVKSTNELDFNGIKFDVKGDGGGVIVPPSPGRVWVIDPWGAPAALRELTPEVLAIVAHTNGKVAPATQRGLRSHLKRAETMQEGDGRNDHIAKTAGHVAAKSDGPSEVKRRLRDANRRFQEPLDDAEVEKVAESIWGKEERKRDAEYATRATNIGNAERFVVQHGQDVRFSQAVNKWYVWDGRRWAIDESGEVVRRAIATVRGIYEEAKQADDADQRARLARHAVVSERLSNVRAMLTLAESQPGIPVSQDQLDSDPFLLTCHNGTIDLRTGKLRPHRREDLITMLAPVEYDKTAKCPFWDSCLDTWFAGSKSLITFTQKSAGYSATGDTGEKSIYVAHGGGDNGKTALLETISGVLGGYALATPGQTLLQSRGDAIPNDVAQLKGVRFVYTSESGEDARLAEARVKSLTGGDTIPARFMRGEWFRFSPTFKLWLATNHKPEIRGTDRAIWKRIKPIPFLVTIPEEEQIKLPVLMGMLRDEWPGILAWIVRGALKWQREGLGDVAEVARARDEYRAEMDVLGAFLDERCVIDRRKKIRAETLYTMYQAWAVATGEKPWTQKAFGMRMRERGFKSDRLTAGEHKGRTVWFGVGMRLGGEG